MKDIPTIHRLVFNIKSIYILKEKCFFYNFAVWQN